MKKILSFRDFQKNMQEQEILNRLNVLRGLFAVLVVLGHCGRRFSSEQCLLVIPHYGAFIWVCFFFFISGWSMTYNFAQKESYLKNFWRRKIFKLFFLAIQTEVIKKFIDIVLMHDTSYTLVALLGDINWYIYEIIALYILFWLVFRFVYVSIWREILVWCGVIAISGATWWLYLHGSWSGWTYAFYFSVWSFAFGVSFHRIYEYLQAKAKMCIFLSTMGAIIGVACIAISKKDFVGGIILHNVFGLSCMLFLVYAVKLIDVKCIRGAWGGIAYYKCLNLHLFISIHYTGCCEVLLYRD